jgi:hypothetical protein
LSRLGAALRVKSLVKTFTSGCRGRLRPATGSPVV